MAFILDDDDDGLLKTGLVAATGECMGKRKKHAATGASSPSAFQGQTDNGAEQLFTGFSFPDLPNHVIPALVEKRTVETVRLLANSVKPPLQPTGNICSHQVRSSPTAEKGLFATKKLQTGDLIFSERPLIVTMSRFTDKTPADLEQCLQVLWMRLPDEQGMALATLHHSPNPPLPLQDIISLNGWGFDPHPGAAYHTGIFPTYARCNHSCAPNAMARFNHVTFAIELRAVRAVAPREELFVSYVDVLDARATRDQALRNNYGFACRCRICVYSGTGTGVGVEPDMTKCAESDARRVSIRSRSGLMEKYRAWRDDPSSFSSPPTEIISAAITSVVTCTREGLEPFAWQDFQVLYMCYGVLGDEKNFKKWRTAFRDCFLVNVGVTPEYDIACREIQDPNRWTDWAVWKTTQGTKDSE